MSVDIAVSDCLDLTDECKTKSGLYVLTRDMLQSIINIAYIQGDIDGSEHSAERIAQTIEARISNGWDKP